MTDYLDQLRVKADPVPVEVMRLWRCPEPCNWWYFCPLLGYWLACNGSMEAAWRLIRGDLVKLS